MAKRAAETEKQRELRKRELCSERLAIECSDQIGPRLRRTSANQSQRLAAVTPI